MININLEFESFSSLKAISFSHFFPFFFVTYKLKVSFRMKIENVHVESNFIQYHVNLLQYRDILNIV